MVLVGLVGLVVLVGSGLFVVGLVAAFVVVWGVDEVVMVIWVFGLLFILRFVVIVVVSAVVSFLVIHVV